MSAKIDLTNEQFDRLRAIRPTEERDTSGSIIWECQCSCGNTIYTSARHLRNGSSKSCGCGKREKLAERTRRDLTGMHFGRLEAIRPTAERRQRSIVWECQCQCGKIALVSAANLTKGYTHSCGCLNHETQQTMLNQRVKADVTDGTRLSFLNRNKFSNNTSGHRGVSYYKAAGKWVASIAFKGDHYYLGIYKNFDDAVKARETAEEALWWPFVEQHIGSFDDEDDRKKKLAAYLHEIISKAQTKTNVPK